MRFLLVYGRVIGLLGRDLRIAALLTGANLLVAALQYLDPMLFGQVVSLLARSDQLSPEALWTQAAALLAIWASVGLGGMGFQCEVAGVEEAHDRVRDVAHESLGTCRQKKRIVLPPHCKEGRLVGAEVGLEGWVERDVALVVAEQVELHLIGAGPGKVEVVERIAVGGDPRRIGNAMRVLPGSRLRLQESTQGLTVGR
jgi:hypothetical protein